MGSKVYFLPLQIINKFVLGYYFSAMSAIYCGAKKMQTQYIVLFLYEFIFKSMSLKKLRGLIGD